MNQNHTCYCNNYIVIDIAISLNILILSSYTSLLMLHRAHDFVCQMMYKMLDREVILFKAMFFASNHLEDDSLFP